MNDYKELKIKNIEQQNKTIQSVIDKTILITELNGLLTYEMYNYNKTYQKYKFKKYIK